MSITSSSTTPQLTAVAPVAAPIGVGAKNSGYSPDSDEYRSEMIAKTAAKMHELPTSLVHFLCGPLRQSKTSPKPDPLCELMRELLRASSVNESSSETAAQHHQIASADGLAQGLRWIYQIQEEMGEQKCLRLVSKSLMPMYLAAGQGRSGSGWHDTLSLVRSACALVEMDRLTVNHDLAEWLSTKEINSEPFRSIHQSFRILMPRMSEIFWDEVGKSRQVVGRTASVAKAKSMTDKQQEAWWSLACQFCDQKPQITVPADLSIGLIDWNKLLDHWHRVVGVLNNVESKSEKSMFADKSAKAMDPAKTNGSEGAVPSKPKLDDRRFVEIRSVKDPQLSSNLDRLLLQARNDQGFLTLIVVKKLGASGEGAAAAAGALQNWQSDFIRLIDAHGESANVRGFLSDDGELTLVFQDVERTEVAQWIRESFAKMGTQHRSPSLATTAALPLVAGVASVNAPSRSFKIEQLIQAAWRCLDGAASQGASAVKTIEVY
jgi:hypothetical protein